MVLGILVPAVGLTKFNCMIWDHSESLLNVFPMCCIESQTSLIPSGIQRLTFDYLFQTWANIREFNSAILKAYWRGFDA